eukprot:gene2707-3903_t
MKTKIILFFLFITLFCSYTLAEESSVHKVEQGECPAPKSKIVVFVLSIMLGTLGVDRFYTGYILLGILKLLITFLSFGLFGWIWWLIDFVLILDGTWNAEKSGCKFKRDF